MPHAAVPTEGVPKNMHAKTKLHISFRLEDAESLREAVAKLPPYSRESFVEHTPGLWRGDFVISCSEAPELAEGDFVDDFAPYFGALLKLKERHEAEFVLQVAVGIPGPEEFELPSHMVALVAALGASLRITTSQNAGRLE